MATNGMRTRKGVMWVEMDASDLRERLAGISASRLMRDQRFRRITVHCGLKAKAVAVQATRAAVPADPREAWRAVSLGYSDRKGSPVLFLGINETRDVDKRAWNPRRKGTRGVRAISARTKALNTYFGRSRAFVLRFLNSGTEPRLTKHRGRWDKAHKVYGRKRMTKGKAAFRGAITKTKGFFIRPAKRALAQVSAEWLEMTSGLIARIMNR